MEAVIWGVPGLAVSLDSPESHPGEVDYGPAARVAKRVAEGILHNGLPGGILLNVNVPFLKDEKIKGVRVTRQGLRVYNDRLDRRLDPRSVPYYWIGGEFPTGVPDAGTDFGALAEGCVSVTPLHLDLTAHQAAGEVRAWAEGLGIPGE
jgi:5'-nucleotidase